ncbi:MAG: glycosyltransferase family 39 protein [Candidatus Omnitrophica bacterium]|nr:glycosyltransferase family 39 protein [Candidatus Omnitrophota bacterium]
MSSPWTKIEIFILAALLIFNALAALHGIATLGIDTDEVDDACGVIAPLNKTMTSSSCVSVSLFGRNWPIMTLPYHASLQAYLVLPALLAFHINVFALRITPIAFGTLALLMTYLFARRIFGRSVALLSLSLLATNPMFIFFTKIGNFTSSYQAFFTMAALYSFLTWYRGGRRIYYLVGCLFLGLGSCTRGWFLFVVAALLVNAIIFSRSIRMRLDRDNHKALPVFLCLGLLSYCAGGFLLLYANFFNASSRFITFKSIAAYWRSTPIYGVDNFYYAGNLWQSLRTFWALLVQNPIQLSYLPPLPENTWHLVGFIFSFIYLTGFLFYQKTGGFSKKWICFMLVFLVTMLLSSSFTVSFFQSHHLFALLPMVSILTSVGLVAAGRFFTHRVARFFVQGAVTVFFVVLIFTNLRGFIQRTILLDKTGGFAQWSYAVYPLVDWIKARKPRVIFAFNQGYDKIAFFLLGGKETVHCLYAATQEQYIEKAAAFCNAENGILYRAWFTNPTPKEAARFTMLKKTAASIGKTIVEEKIFCRRDGVPMYIVYSVR